MNPKILGVILTIVGAGMIIINAPLKPFDSDFEGPLVIVFEFAGPLVFTIGATVFGYQLRTYIKKKEWPEMLPQKLLVASIIVGLVVSVVYFIIRLI